MIELKIYILLQTTINMSSLALAYNGFYPPPGPLLIQNPAPAIVPLVPTQLSPAVLYGNELPMPPAETPELITTSPLVPLGQFQTKRRFSDDDCAVRYTAGERSSVDIELTRGEFAVLCMLGGIGLSLLFRDVVQLLTTRDMFKIRIPNAT